MQTSQLRMKNSMPLRVECSLLNSHDLKFRESSTSCSLIGGALSPCCASYKLLRQRLDKLLGKIHFSSTSFVFAQGQKCDFRLQPGLKFLLLYKLIACIVSSGSNLKALWILISLLKTSKIWANVGCTQEALPGILVSVVRKHPVPSGNKRTLPMRSCWACKASK